MAAHRLFFALPLPRLASETLERWRRPLPLSAGRWVPMANLHLTLAFLGSVDDHALDALLDSDMTGLRPFELTFGELGYFAKAKVLFVAPLTTPPELLQLAEHCQRLQGRWGNSKKETRYQPHITLARDVEPPVPPAAMPLALSFACDHVGLFASHNSKDGVRYQELASWPLRKPLRPQPG